MRMAGAEMRVAVVATRMAGAEMHVAVAAARMAGAEMHVAAAATRMAGGEMHVAVAATRMAGGEIRLLVRPATPVTLQTGDLGDTFLFPGTAFREVRGRGLAGRVTRARKSRNVGRAVGLRR
jgi:hypothetical protein